MEYRYATTAHTSIKSHYLFDAMIFVINCLDSVQLYRCKYDECDVLLVNNEFNVVNHVVKMLEMTILQEIGENC